MTGLEPAIPRSEVWCLIHQATWSPLELQPIWTVHAFTYFTRACNPTNFQKNFSQLVGFEPTLPKGNSFRVSRLNHSATTADTDIACNQNTVWFLWEIVNLKCAGIVGSVVECSPATRAARVRFPDDAYFSYFKIPPPVIRNHCRCLNFQLYFSPMILCKNCLATLPSLLSTVQMSPVQLSSCLPSTTVQLQLLTAGQIVGM